MNNVLMLPMLKYIRTSIVKHKKGKNSNIFRLPVSTWIVKLFIQVKGKKVDFLLSP